MASYFPLKTLWRSYFCALVATGVLAVRLHTYKSCNGANSDLDNKSIPHGSAGHVPGPVRPILAFF